MHRPETCKQDREESPGSKFDWCGWDEKDHEEKHEKGDEQIDAADHVPEKLFGKVDVLRKMEEGISAKNEKENG